MDTPRPEEPDPPLRASDADRDGTVERLASAVADGRLTLEEYTDRSGRALETRTVPDLDALTRDLPAQVEAPAPTGERLTAILGNESRKGRWTVPERLTVKSVLGDCHIELQEARLASGVTRIDATAILGSITIFVPDGVDVRLTGRAVLGQRSSQMSGEIVPGAPVIEVHCDVRLGAITVRPPDWRMRVGTAVGDVFAERRRPLR